MATSTITDHNKLVTGTVDWATGAKTESDTRFATTLHRHGKLVVFQCAAELTNTYFSTTYTTICTLPAGFRPANELMGAAAVGTSVWGANSKAKFYLTADGTVSIYATANTSAGESASCNHVQFCVTYIAG